MALRAFTLIELLIVVAIIAILAAIAVPNFLEAQTRAKVVRAKADMRSLVVGLESYAVDTNHYPYPATPFGAPEAVPGVTDWFQTKVPRSVTTPIAYLTTRFADPYTPADALAIGEDPVYHLMTRAYASRMAPSREAAFDQYLTDVLAGSRSTAYVMLCHGPDLFHDAPDPAQNPGGPRRYDPTNGTVSRGDVLYFGPGVGF